VALAGLALKQRGLASQQEEQNAMAGIRNWAAAVEKEFQLWVKIKKENPHLWNVLN